MEITHITVTNPKGKSITVPVRLLERATLNAAGGGYNALQTAKAMELGRLVRDGKTAQHRGWKIEPAVVEDAQQAV